MADTRASSLKMGGQRPRAGGGSDASASFAAVNLTLAELKTAIDQLKTEVANLRIEN